MHACMHARMYVCVCVCVYCFLCIETLACRIKNDLCCHVFLNFALRVLFAQSANGVSVIGKQSLNPKAVDCRLQAKKAKQGENKKTTANDRKHGHTRPFFDKPLRRRVEPHDFFRKASSGVRRLST